MKTRSLLALGVVLPSLLVATRADAAGTALDVQSGRATGMASAMTAMTDDSASIYFNPAGIARGKRLDAQAGLTLIAPSFRFTSPAGNETKMPFSVIPPLNAYVSGGITENLSVGIGVFTPYGLDIDWGSKTWEGRRFLTEASLRTWVANPTIAATFGPVRIGAGFQLMRATVRLQRQISFGSTEGGVDLGGSAWGVGANGGVQVDAIKKYLTLGAHYRSAIKVNFDNGRAHFDNVPPEFASTIHDQRVQTSLVNPDQLAFGVASQPIKALTIDADVVWLGWEKFRAINLHFPDDRTGTLDSHEPKNWSNRVNYHLGGEGKINESFFVRAGVLYDPSPSPKNTLLPDIPDAHRLNLAVGGSYHHPIGFRVDVGYQHLILFTRQSTAPAFPGEYGGSVNILGISVGFASPVKEEARREPEPEPAAPPPEPTPASEPAPTPEPPPEGGTQ